MTATQGGASWPIGHAALPWADLSRPYRDLKPESATPRVLKGRNKPARGKVEGAMPRKRHPGY